MGAKPRARSEPAAARPASNAEFFTPEYLERRRRIMARRSGFKGMDDLNPKAPAGHADGIRTSTWLTQSVKHTHRKHAMNISPQDVIDLLVAAGVKNWVLMGLHASVGYLPEPRATQDVDVMVPFAQRKRAAKGGPTTTASTATICGSWRIGCGTGPARRSIGSWKSPWATSRFLHKPNCSLPLPRGPDG